MAGRRITVAAIGTALLFLCSYATGQSIVWSPGQKLSVSPAGKSDQPTAGAPVWSPDHKLYAVDSPGQKVGKGEERERLEVFTEGGKNIAVAHVWLVEPDGTYRAGIRGCESWGWVDSARLFCEGTINPNYGIYLLFDARSGRELWEMIGTGFVWSPDHAHIADVGTALDLEDASATSMPIDLDGKPVFPSAKDKDTEQHWFRSAPVWSPDSRSLAFVDDRQKQRALYLVVIGVDGSRFERKLQWQEKEEDLDPFSVQWAGNQVIVAHNESRQSIPIPH